MKDELTELEKIRGMRMNKFDIELSEEPLVQGKTTEFVPKKVYYGTPKSSKWLSGYPLIFRGEES